jgi:hypothetical protein
MEANRMKTLNLFLPLMILSLLFLFGCSQDQGNKEGDARLIASEKSLPANFHQIAYERNTTPFFQYLVRKTSSQTAFEETWGVFEFTSQQPKVDLSEKDILFVGIQESGSCPYEIETIETSSDKKEITVSLSEPEGACTDDATPRTFVIEIDKEVSQEVKNVVIVQSQVETSIPIKN